MRPIKFRAWIKKPNGENIVSPAMGYGAQNWAGFGDLCSNKNEDIVLMQFTGLLDKNGKEIYEGDITLHKCKFPKYERVAVVEWGREKNTGMWELKTILFQNGDSSELNRKLDKPYYEPFGVACLAELIEVIGNIYENPELLSNQ